MKFCAEDQLTIAVCEHFIHEASEVFKEQGWDDINLISFPARCGKPFIAEEEITILPHRSSHTILIGGPCLADVQKLQTIKTVIEKNCFHFLCGTSFVQQLLAGGARLISPAWLRQWSEGSEVSMPCQFGSKEFNDLVSRKVVLIDTLIDDQSKELFRNFLKTSGVKG
jgi:hypothetical protein